LTSKNTINVRFILRILLWRSSRPTDRASAAAKRAQRAKRSAESAGWAAPRGGHSHLPITSRCLHAHIFIASRAFPTTHAHTIFSRLSAPHNLF
jgi:hypothetical protein